MKQIHTISSHHKMSKEKHMRKNAMGKEWKRDFMGKSATKSPGGLLCSRTFVERIQSLHQRRSEQQPHEEEKESNINSNSKQQQGRQQGRQQHQQQLTWA